MKFLIYSLTSIFLIVFSFTSCDLQQKATTRNHEEEPEYIDSLLEEREILLPFNITKGKELFDSNQVELTFEQDGKLMSIHVSIDLGKEVVIPTVYNRDFKNKEDANYLAFSMKFEWGKEYFSVFDSKPLSDGTADFYFEVLPSDLYTIESGEQEFNVKLSGEFVSFFSVRSKVKPIQAEVKMKYKVPEIYKSTVYFKSLKLNKESVTKLLGDNDFSNDAPETGIYVSYENETVMIENTENSFEYRVKHKADFYHLSPDDQIDVEAIDKDYFLNPNDYIAGRYFRIKELESETYKNYPMEHIEELWIYCKQHGKIN
jgi:hypothetical protein